MSDKYVKNEELLHPERYIKKQNRVLGLYIEVAFPSHYRNSS